ncbi:MAG TPA: glucoamylase family protein [Terracidiphilus sp.]|nr:glucoamylase family protein [Terracidiphilus sp.]
MSYIHRRQALKLLALAAGSAACSASLSARTLSAAQTPRIARDDEAFLDDLIRQGCLYFWEQGHPATGQVLDRSRNDLNGARDPRRMASIAATGFGLTALCIADHRGYVPYSQVVDRVRTTLDWHLNHLPEVHGFFYHFSDVETGRRWRRSELSSIDTSILLCGIQTARAYFADARIQSLAQQLYERVDWPWMLNDGQAFAMGWFPDSGFIPGRWSHYCELMMIYLLAIGSPTHPVSPEHWNSFTRPVIDYAGMSFIGGNDPIFTHQYSHAWFDFRHKRDGYADYFANSRVATRAHKAFCLSMPKWYSNNYWGITASDSIHGYTVWGGPPSRGLIDGTVVPSAAAGSLPFLPGECLSVLRSLRAKYPQAWGRYGFLDAFHPSANWYNPDVLGIDLGISVLMAENLRSELVWQTFMRNPEADRAMRLVGFHPDSLA